MNRTINWTPDKLAAVKVAYDQALKADKRQSDVFKVTLPGETAPAEFVVAYARHMIEYLEGEFARNPPRTYTDNREGEEGQ